MRNYIILNDINSNTISGLLIQELAPISKPLVRTQIEEIDGRDGDIVTKLGFSAYDKQITVGVYGDYDINEIIAFFNSEGTVTFSNEPDKYYNYQIIDQIDFDRLIRYRTATVTMHCQPFKYATDESDKIFTSSLLSLPDFAQTQNGVTVKAANGVISFSGTASAGTEFYVPVNALTLSAGGYVLKAMTSGTNASQAALRLIYNSPSNANSFGGKYVTLANNSTVSISANLTASKTYNYLYFYVNTGQAMDFTLSVSVENAITDEGSSLVLENTPEDLFDVLDPKGNATQTTYSGKNLIKVNDVANTNQTIQYYRQYSPQINTTLEAGQTYTFSADVTIGGSVSSCRLNMGCGAGSFQKDIYGETVTSGKASITFTPTADQLADGRTQFYFRFPYIAGTTEGVDYSFKNVMLEKGSSASAYEPYVGGTASPNPDYPQEMQVVTGENTTQITDGDSQSQSYPIDWGNEYLAAIPNTDYKDYPVKVGDTWYIRRKVGKATVSLGTTVYTLSGGLKGATYAPINKESGYGLALCDRATKVDGSAIHDGSFYENPANFMFVGSTSDTADTLKAKYDGAILFYRLATPVDEEITNETLISQLEALKQAHAYEGRTHIMAIAESGNAPHIIEAGISTASNAGTIINSGNYYSRPTLTIYGFGDITLSLNGNQIFNISLGSQGYITIDTNLMEAYQGTTDNLMNRLVDGDYNNFKLNVGRNTISWSGDVSKIVIENYSRWL